ncbi:MAG: glucose-6-phosphate isomerase [Anaerolineales bacterium]
MRTVPYSFDVSVEDKILSEYDNHIVRKLSAMKGQFLDEDAYRHMVEDGDPALYEVYALDRPEVAGEIRHGLSVVHPGTVGKEFYMTKGHFHEVLETSEIYYCLRGRGMMVMETPEGEWAVEPLKPGSVLYVPPRWAHRSVNTGLKESLVTFFAYPSNAGHDYGSIEKQGFRKLILNKNGEPEIVDNPRWLPPEKR